MKPTASQIRALGRRDPRLGAAMRRLPPFPGFPDATHKTQRSHYDALARAIVFQQLAGKAAATIHARVCALTAGPHFPRAHEILALEDQRLRGAGLSGAKLAARRDLARRVEDGRLALRTLSRMRDEEIVDALTQVRGIGEWSAHMFLLFRLGRLDVAAPGDLGVREGLRLLDGGSERPTPKAALLRTEAWCPLRSVGTWMMWRLVEKERAKLAARRPLDARPAPRPASRPASRPGGR
jgi:DNA-3-methyladenine glycosylase II